MGPTVRSSTSSLPFSGRLAPGEAGILFHDIPSFLLGSPVFDNTYHTSSQSSTLTPEAAVDVYLHAAVSHLHVLVTPGHELLALYHTVLRIRRVRDMLKRISDAQRELRERTDLDLVVEARPAWVSIIRSLCVLVGDLAVFIRYLQPGLRDVVASFGDRMERAARTRGRGRGTMASRRVGRDGRADRRARRNRNRGLGHGGQELVTVELDDSAGGPLGERIVRTMVQMMYSEVMLVLAWHEFVAVMDSLVQV
ncbi:hypothetical protein SCAR479_12013 [Seiridium cardinale]|uniref:Spindle pole body component n=1 Tax=Seiridium cardinale TaxID=138064 RepID=A0ABR2XC63_9PEZI